jgi:hypothetical protein
VSFEDRQDLLGHRSGRITTHYSAAVSRIQILDVHWLLLIDQGASTDVFAVLFTTMQDCLPQGFRSP